jgi:hypothetical protein
MNVQPIKQYVDVVNGMIHLKLPEGFDAQRVELIIMPVIEGKSQLSSFQQFLLDSPEMTDNEFQAIKVKREHLNQWK